MKMNTQILSCKVCANFNTSKCIHKSCALCVVKHKAKTYCMSIKECRDKAERGYVKYCSALVVQTEWDM